MTKAKMTGFGFYGHEYGFRPNTKINHWPLNFILSRGGMGDFINYTAAILWVANNCPWVEGRIFSPKYFHGFLRDVFRGIKNWSILPSENFTDLIEPGTGFLAPSICENGKEVRRQLLNPIGCHLMDAGFAYYAGTTPPPKDLYLPRLNYPRKKLHTKVKLLKKYAVIPTGASGDSRRVHGRHINPIINYLLSKDVTPVFLGKTDLLNDGKTITTFPEDINYGAGLDLRNQTSVQEAACVMQHAEMTLGLDCGLLHLAACMENSRLIFGYNITSIEHREPRRTWGKTINVAVDEKDLICAPCQSKSKHIAGHLFSECLYKDSKCIDVLFINKLSEWKSAIDEMLGIG